MSKQSQFESLDDMLSELNNISEDGGLVENVILLARVFDNDSEEERLFLGWSPDVFDDPTKVLGHIELVKARLFDLLSIRRQAN
jgi:hypothetical protein